MEVARGSSGENAISTRVLSKPRAEETNPPTPVDPTAEPSPFARLLTNLGREVDQGERTMHRVIGGGGRDLGPQELLSLQAGVYRYSEAVDLSAKVVDRASSSLKTVLQGQ